MEFTSNLTKKQNSKVKFIFLEKRNNFLKLKEDLIKLNILKNSEIVDYEDVSEFERSCSLSSIFIIPLKVPHVVTVESSIKYGLPMMLFQFDDYKGLIKDSFCYSLKFEIYNKGELVEKFSQYLEMLFFDSYACKLLKNNVRQFSASLSLNGEVSH